MIKLCMLVTNLVSLLHNGSRLTQFFSLLHNKPIVTHKLKEDSLIKSSLRDRLVTKDYNKTERDDTAKSLRAQWLLQENESGTSGLVSNIGHSVLTASVTWKNFHETRPKCLPSGGSRICEKGGPGIQMPRCRARPGGGLGWTPTHFFFLKFFKRHLHYGVGVPSTCQTDLRGWQEKKNAPQKGGVRFPPPPPPRIRHCLPMVFLSDVGEVWVPLGPAVVSLLPQACHCIYLLVLLQVDVLGLYQEEKYTTIGKYVVCFFCQIKCDFEWH